MREIESIKLVVDHELNKVEITFKPKTNPEGTFVAQSETFTMTKGQADSLARKIKAAVDEKVITEFKL